MTPVTCGRQHTHIKVELFAERDSVAYTRWCEVMLAVRVSGRKVTDQYTVKPPNNGHFVCYRGLSSLRRLKCTLTIMSA